MPERQSPISISISNSSANWDYNTQGYDTALPISSSRPHSFKPSQKQNPLVEIPDSAKIFSSSPTADQTVYTQPTLQGILTTSPQSCQEDLLTPEMFAAMRSALGGGGGGGGAIMAVQMELQQLKVAPILNPNFGMVTKYLDCLNRYMDAVMMTQGPAGVKMWLLEVQTFIRQLQKRIFQRMPLLPQEKQGILSFAAYWRQMVGPPYGMGRPEAQLVLITLTEFAQR